MVEGLGMESQILCDIGKDSIKILLLNTIFSVDKLRKLYNQIFQGVVSNCSKFWCQNFSLIILYLYLFVCLFVCLHLILGQP